MKLELSEFDFAMIKLHLKSLRSKAEYGILEYGDDELLRRIIDSVNDLLVKLDKGRFYERNNHIRN